MRLYSDYYEGSFDLDEEDLDVLLGIYTKVAEEHNFEPDATHIDDMIDGGALDTVLYHVEEFGKGHKDYEKVSHLFM